MVYPIKITDLHHLREQITNKCAEIDDNADQFHRVHTNFLKRVKLWIENNGKSG